MLNEIKKLVQKDPKLQLLLFGALIVQLVTCITAVGFFQPDQHFQVIEFSSFQLHKASGATHVWELNDFVRPTLQVYLFSAYSIICGFLNINDPYLQLTILRIILGIKMFIIFNLITIYYLKNENRKVLYYALLILNFSWLFPYIRTLFSSEILSSIVFSEHFFYMI
jgi:phosphatidylinositol glycan class B